MGNLNTCGVQYIYENVNRPHYVAAGPPLISQ